jgi:CRISPR-associated endoribonuclease Cas6
MLASLVVQLEADGPVTLPVTHGEAMQSELFRQLTDLDPAATQRVHGQADERPRPYTISPIYPDHPFLRSGMLYFQPGQRGWFRLTGLEPEASQFLLALSECSRSWQIQGSSFGGNFSIRRWFTLPGEHPWAGLISLEELGESAWQAADQEPERILLNFYTPTCFKTGSGSEFGNWMPLPVPRLVFGSLRNRVAAFCPELGQPPAPADLIEGRIALGRFGKLESQMLFFQKRNRRQTGFTGECEFLLDPRLTLPERLWLHLLANFAFYGGVGTSTSWGMGQARREPADQFTYRGLSAQRAALR